MILIGLLVSTMICTASILIKTSLLASVVLSFLTAIGGILSGQILVTILGFIFFAIGVCYTCAVWKAIPFATANLITAVHAIRSNCGLSLVAYFFLILAFTWSVTWAICLVGLYNEFGSLNNGYIFLLFVSYFWTHQVIQNTIHVTVAGVSSSILIDVELINHLYKHYALPLGCWYMVVCSERSIFVLLKGNIRFVL